MKELDKALEAVADPNCPSFVSTLRQKEIEI
jgi:hypothetical protein